MVDALVKGYGGEIREPKVGRADSNQRPREQMVADNAESQSGTLGQVQKSRLLGTQNLGSMNPWSLRSLPPLRPVGR